MQEINIITDTGESDFFCRMCVSKKLFLFDKPNQLFKCPDCGSLFKYTKPKGKPRIGIDNELDNEAGTKVIFYTPESPRKRALPEVEGNIQIKAEFDVIRSD